MLAGAARTYLHRYGVLAGPRGRRVHHQRQRLRRRASTSPTPACEVARRRRRPPGRPPARWAGECARAGHRGPHRAASSPARDGVERVTARARRRRSRDGVLGESRAHRLRPAAGLRRLEPRGAPVQPGPRPAALRRRARRVRARRACSPAASVAGAAAGRVRPRAAASPTGRRAAAAALERPRLSPSERRRPACRRRRTGRRAARWCCGWCPDPTGADDAHRSSSTCSATRPSPTSPAPPAPGMRSVEHVKRYTTIGTAHDQGKTSGVIASGIIADAARRRRSRELGTTTFRPPYTPVAFAALAGRDRGRAVRPRARHRHARLARRARRRVRGRRAVEAPLVLPAGRARTWTPRCCASARPSATGVGIMDASTLGKIDVQGPDAGEFLDRLYTNLMSTLKVGSIRYGVMCGADGMVFDDGTVHAPRRRPVPASPPPPAARREVLDWMEEWLQTEWPRAAGALHVGDRAVGHRRRRRARARGTSSAAVAPTLDVSTTRRSRS